MMILGWLVCWFRGSHRSYYAVESLLKPDPKIPGDVYGQISPCLTCGKAASFGIHPESWIELRWRWGK